MSGKEQRRAHRTSRRSVISNELSKRARESHSEGAVKFKLPPCVHIQRLLAARAALSAER